MAPGLPKEFRPSAGQPPKKGQWYEGLEYGEGVSANKDFYGSRIHKAGLYDYQAARPSRRVGRNQRVGVRACLGVGARLCVFRARARVV